MKKIRTILLALIVPIVLQAQQIVVDKAEYRSVYDLGLLCPTQVFYTLHSSDMGDTSREPSWRFRADIKHPAAQARHSDFNKSGYHRGHLCAAADRSKTIEDMKATFAMSNVAPQLPSINCGSWKQTENSCRLAASIYDSVCVLVCPVFLHRDTARIGRHHIAVPHAFFKAVWCASNDSVLYSWFIFNQ